VTPASYLGRDRRERGEREGRERGEREREKRGGKGG